MLSHQETELKLREAFMFSVLLVLALSRLSTETQAGAKVGWRREGWVIYRRKEHQNSVGQIWDTGLALFGAFLWGLCFTFSDAPSLELVAHGEGALSLVSYWCR